VAGSAFGSLTVPPTPLSLRRIAEIKTTPGSLCSKPPVGRDQTCASSISFLEGRYIYAVAAFVANIGDHFVKLAHDADMAALGTSAFQHAVLAKLFGGMGDPDRGVLGADALDEIGESCGNVIPEAADALSEVGAGHGADFLAVPHQSDFSGTNEPQHTQYGTATALSSQ
jgi:hypothetical protein